MARYTINYLTGDTENVIAERVNIDDDSKVFVFRTGPLQNEPDAIIPTANVRSIHREDETEPTTAVTYPYRNGDVTVLGPEVFASNDGEAISWKGENYTRRFYPLGRQVTG